MKIALPVHNGSVNDHFGHSEEFIIYTISTDNKVESAQPVGSLEGCGCRSGIAEILSKEGVSVMLAGNIGAGAIDHLNAYGIDVVRGCYGPADSVVNEFLKGSVTDNGQTCTSHEGCDNH
jgi:predicted Fe-Mo cluster-binding NifX family protein